MTTPVLEVKELRTSFYTHVGEVKAVNGISFSVYPGETLGIVGESGSGKSATALSVLNLLPHPGRVISGSILFEGIELTTVKAKAMHQTRGNRIGMIFQDPMTSLNPVYTIGHQIMEPLMHHQRLNRQAAREKVIKLLHAVGIPNPERRFSQYPHQFSGGMRQRAMIAMALSCQPKLLIADEPTTALDVTIQAQIIQLMKGLTSKTYTSIILITHDLGMVAETCNRILVMYGGSIMEQGSVRDIFHRPGHPYTQGLLRSLPDLRNERTIKLIPIDGQPPDLIKLPEGCPFWPRCRDAMLICQEQFPLITTIEPGHEAACWLQHPLAPQPVRRDA